MLVDDGILREYTKVLEFCRGHRLALPEQLLQQAVDFQEGLWKTYCSLLRTIPLPIKGRTVVDFGCKYGHLLPLLVGLGAETAIGIDAEEEYVRAGKLVFEDLYQNVRILECESGHIPLQPDSVDICVMNEVVSHINPGFLDRVWSEVSRILKMDGILFISDGNNSAHPYAGRTLPDLYEKWENGPEGAATDRGTVTRPFVVRRGEIIRRRHPELSDDRIEYLARNTSGLFGSYLEKTIDEYAQSGKLIHRPYRKGICPTNPSCAGAVMERGLHPAYLELALSEYGLEARSHLPESYQERTGLIDLAKGLALSLRHHLRNLLMPGWERSASPGFQIIAFKRRRDP
jgi:SAM-dependent methyltransferase